MEHGWNWCNNPMMGRRKTVNPGLPPRLFVRKGLYYYVQGNKWLPLGKSFAGAIKAWEALEGRKLEGFIVGQAIDRYLLEILPTKADATQREYKRYSKAIRAVFGDQPFDDVRQRDIAQYLDRRTSKYEANREVAFLSSVFSSAQRWGWCDVNPCYGVRRNTEKKRTRHLADAEIAKVRAAASPQVQCIIDMVLMTALRKGDVLQLRLVDYTEQGLKAVIHKTGHVLVFERTEALEALWLRCRQLRRRVGSFYLFANRKGQPYTTSGFDCIWQRTVKRAKVTDFRFHDLRARALTTAEKRFGIEFARTLAAHMNVTTTERYVRDRQLVVVRPLDQ